MSNMKRTREDVFALPKNDTNYVVLKDYILQHPNDTEAYKMMIRKYLLDIPAFEFSEILSLGRAALGEDDIQELIDLVLYEEAVRLMNNRIFVVSGFSGSGKGSIIKALLQRRTDIELVKSVTTREPRSTDDFYDFVDEMTFHALEKKGRLLESNEYNGCFYGTPKSELTRILGMKDKNALLEIDVNGFSEVLKNGYIPQDNLRSIFIVTDTAETLFNRLLNRNSESVQQISQRLKESLKECNKISMYDMVVVNDNLNEATNAVLAFLESGAVSNQRIFDCERFKNDLEKIIEELESTDSLKSLVCKGKES